MRLLRFLVVALILTMICSFACAEDGFVLRNGIVFGDTIDDIVEKETVLKRTNDNSFKFTGRIAGFDDSECEFYFDDEGKLESMLYSFDCYSKDTTTSDYKTLYDSLVRKYGKPKGNRGGSCELITGPAIDRMAFWVYLFGEFDGCSADYYDYDEWVVDCTDYHVKIDLTSYYYRNKEYEYTYSINLSYHKYTDEEFQEAVNQKKNERDEVDNDL